MAVAMLEQLKPALASPVIPSADSEGLHPMSPVIMRIDNIAWDSTPDMLEQFLPPGVLANTLQPVHLLIVREDGRSKDYLVRCFWLDFVLIHWLTPYGVSSSLK